MTRFASLRSLTVAAVAPPETALPGSEYARATQVPNVLMFQDNISIGNLGCYGSAYPLGARTPNIDRFAAESPLLTNYNVEAQSPQPLRIHDRQALGSQWLHHGPAGFVACGVTIAEMLKELGYSNACYGKWHCGEDVGHANGHDAALGRLASAHLEERRRLEGARSYDITFAGGQEPLANGFHDSSRP